MAQIFTQGTATASDVLTGKTFNAGVLYGVSGTIANNGAGGTVTPTTTSQTKAAGYYSSAITISGDANLVSSNIKSGVSIFGVTGSSTVVDTSTGTATAANILSGKIAFVGGVSVTGTIPTIALDYGNHYFTTGVSVGVYSGDGNTRVYIRPKNYGSAWYYPGGDYWFSVVENNFLASNIKAGVSILGVTGNFTSDASATADFLLTGQTAYVNGTKITGTMTDYRATWGQSTQVVGWDGRVHLYPPTGYYNTAANGVGVFYNDANFIAANIRSGTTVLGITGTMTPGSSASGTANASSSYGTLYYSGGSTASSRYITVSGLSFTPKAIMCWSTVQTDMVTTYFENSTSTPIEWSGYGLTSQQYQLAGSAYVTYGGFQMPIRQVNSGELCRWVAYG